MTTEAKKAADKRYVEKNKEEVYKKIQEWRKKNRSKVLGYGLKFRLKNREKVRIRSSKYYQANKDRLHGFRIKRLYGITLSEYYLLLKKQGEGCAICGTDKPYSINYKGKKKFFAIDHDHKTGKTRGILCHDCNRGLGSFVDSIDNLKKAIVYLEQFSKMRL